MEERRNSITLEKNDGSNGIPKSNGELSGTLSGVHSHLLEGIHLLWNDRLKDAEKFFAKYNEPRAHLHKTEVTLMRGLITGQTEIKQSHLKQLKAVDNLIEKIKGDEAEQKKLAKSLFPSLDEKAARKNLDWELHLLHADSLLFRSITQIHLGNKLKGAYNMRKSWKLYEKLLQELQSDKSAAPEVLDCVKFGAGLFYFIVSMTPGAFLKILEVIGFVADRDLGVTYLETVSANNGIRAPFASLTLLLNYLMIPRAFVDTDSDLKAAARILEVCAERHPNSSMLYWLRSHLARKHGDTQLAIKCIETAIQTAQNELQQRPSMFMFDYACCYFMGMHWEKTAEILEPLVKNDGKEFEMRGMCALQLSSCYVMLNQKEKAAALWKEVPNIASKKSRFDKVAMAKAARCVKRGDAPFLGFEILYLRRDLAHMSSDNLLPLSQHIDELWQKHKDTADADNKGTYYLIRGCAHLGLKDVEAAEKCFKEVLALEKSITDEKYLLPFATYELAELYWKKKDISKAEELLKQAQKHANYDWEDVLSNRIRLALHVVAKAKAKK